MCMFPTNSERVIGISEAFSAFCLRVSVIFPTCSLYPQQKRDYSALHPQAGTYTYSSMPVGTYRVQSPGFPKIVYWSSEGNWSSEKARNNSAQHRQTYHTKVKHGSALAQWHVRHVKQVLNRLLIWPQSLSTSAGSVLTPSLPKPIKFPGKKMHAPVCKLYIFQVL